MTTDDPFVTAGQESPKPFSHWQAEPWNDDTQAFFLRVFKHTFDNGAAIELTRQDDGAVLARGARKGKPAAFTTESRAETITREGLWNDYMAALTREATPPRDGHKLIVYHAACDAITRTCSSIDRDTLLSVSAFRMQKPKKGADRRRSDSAPRALRELLADGVLHVIPGGRIAITYDDRFEDEEGADDGDEA